MCQPENNYTITGDSPLREPLIIQFLASLADSLRFAVKQKRFNRKERKELRKVCKESIRCAFGTNQYQYKRLIFRCAVCTIPATAPLKGPRYWSTGEHVGADAWIAHGLTRITRNRLARIARKGSAWITL